MKLSVIALDYDGTISRNDTLDPSVRDAIAAARRAGIVVLLVTGRILEDLRRVAGDLHFVDGVVAENGAVVHFPDSGHTSALGAAISSGFVEELNRRGILFQTGRCLIDAPASEATRLLEAIRVLCMCVIDPEGDYRSLEGLPGVTVTVVTYCASRLPKELLAATDVMIVTCESNPAEIEALCRCCAGCGYVDRARWSILGHLRSGQAVALPITAEAGGDLRLFTIAPRLTPHVRHREKYVDVPVSERQAFVFGPNGQPSAHRVRTLRQFVLQLESMPAPLLEPYLRRGDSSRWIGDVFGDQALAGELRTLEEQHRDSARSETVPEVAAAIRARYDLVEDEITDGTKKHALPERQSV